MDTFCFGQNLKVPLHLADYLKGQGWYNNIAKCHIASLKSHYAAIQWQKR